MTAPRIAGFDPIRAGDAASASAYALIYEGLLQFDPGAVPHRVVPALAEDLPEVSADQLTLRFRIRRGIHFADDPCFRATGGKGREVVARDWIYSILRVADARNASPGYWAFRNRIAGLDAFRTRTAESPAADYDTPVEGLVEKDRYTVEIRLLRPYPQILWVLAMHYAYVVPREAVEAYGDRFPGHPVGTGPFVLESWRRNYRMTFRRNPKWEETGRREIVPAAVADGRPPAGRVPGVDRLVQWVVSDPSTQWQMFLSGGLAFSGVSRDNWDAVMDGEGGLTESVRGRGIGLVSRTAPDLYYIGFNMDDPVVGANPALRRAMACAFSTAEWAAFYNGQVIRPNSPVPPGVAGYSTIEDFYPFDLARARQLLAEAGYPGGVDPRTGRRLQLTLEVADPENPDVRQSTDLFVQFMDRIGLTVRPSYNSRPAFFDKLANRRAQMFRLSWIADYPDAQNFLQLFVGAHASPGSNRANYRNPEFDARYAQMESMPDSPARTALCAEMARIVMVDCPWILTHSPRTPVLVQKTVGGYVGGPFSYGFEKYLFLRAGQP